MCVFEGVCVCVGGWGEESGMHTNLFAFCVCMCLCMQLRQTVNVLPRIHQLTNPPK